MIGAVNPQEDYINQALETWILKEIADDPLLKLSRLLDAMVDWRLLEVYYNRWAGRPAYPPKVMFKMELLKRIARDLSDRDLVKECKYNFRFRFFLGLKTFAKVPDDTSLSVFRKRLGEAGFSEIFEKANECAKGLGLVKGETMVYDACHIIADIAIPGMCELLRQGRKAIIKRVKKLNISEGKELMKRYVGKKCRGKPTEAEAVEAIKLTKELIKVAKEKHNKKLADVIEKVERVIAGNLDKLISFVDTDARGGYKSKEKPFIGYKIHTGVDRASGVTTSLETLSGNMKEGSRLPEMVKNDKAKGYKVKEALGDKLYDSGDNRRKLRKMEVVAIIPSRYNKPQIEDFNYDGERVTCPCGKTTDKKIAQGAGELYYFSVKDCGGCSKKEGCVSAKEVRKKVYLSEARKEKLIGGQLKEERREKYKWRIIVEPTYGVARRRYLMLRAKYRGRWRVAIQAITTFLAINLKKFMKILETMPETCAG